MLAEDLLRSLRDLREEFQDGASYYKIFDYRLVEGEELSILPEDQTN